MVGDVVGAFVGEDEGILLGAADGFIVARRDGALLVDGMALGAGLWLGIVDG